jgi:predicted PurR-regulated permease PerM
MTTSKGIIILLLFLIIIIIIGMIHIETHIKDVKNLINRAKELLGLLNSLK